MFTPQPKSHINVGDKQHVHFAPHGCSNNADLVSVTFPTESVRFEVGVFKGCPKLKEVTLPPAVYGVPLCLVFDPGVTIHTQTAINTAVDLYAEEVAKMPLSVPKRHQPETVKDTTTQYVGVATGDTKKDAVDALEFPHSAVLQDAPPTGTDEPTRTSWINTFKAAAGMVLSDSIVSKLLGKTVAYERTIALAMVRDGMVYARFPLPPAVKSVSQLLDYVDASKAIATCDGTHVNRDASVELNKYYAIFSQ